MNIYNHTLKKPEIEFTDLDQAYQIHFIKEYIIAFILFALSIIVCILIKEYWYIAFCVLIMAAYCIYLFLQIYRSLTNRVLVIDGVCIDVSRKESTLFNSKDFASRTCKITIRTDDNMLISMPVPYSSDYKTGVTVRIYANDGTINQLNLNTYTVINPIYMHILAN